MNMQYQLQNPVHNRTVVQRVLLVILSIVFSAWALFGLYDFMSPLLVLAINDAIQPERIEPASAAPNEMSAVAQNQISNLSRQRVSGAGDVNGDGFDDVLVGVPDYDTVDPDSGQLVAFYGSTNGLNAAADWQTDGDGTQYLGHAVSGIGDVNGDGFADILIASPYYDYGSGNEGLVAIYYGAGEGGTATATPTARLATAPTSSTRPSSAAP